MQNVPQIALRLVLFFCLLTALIASSCTKSHPAATYPIDSYVKQFYNYPAGSYWIYRDSLTGDMDSFTVAEYRHTPDSASGGNSSVRYEEVNLTINEYQYPANTRTATWYVQIIDQQANLYFHPVSGGEVDYLLCYPHLQTVPLSYASICQDSVYSSAQFLLNDAIGASVYDSVYATYYAHHADSCYLFSQQDRLFAVKNTGFVKLALKNMVQRTWELQRYHIAL